MSTAPDPSDAIPGRGAQRPGSPTKHTAGAFDIRNIIGALMTAYGVILVAMGLFADQQPAKTGGVNANLWSGLGLLVLGLGFIAWAKLRPVVVDEAELARAHAEQSDRPPGH